MNHTPAPWKAIGLEQGLSLKTAIEETPRKSHNSIKSVLVISTKAKYSIATIRFHPEMSREEITQNAQLIASAPELLKLVTAAVQTLGTSHPIAQKIQAVVSKITGINEPQ
jgi:quinolinate synthase